MKIKKSGEWILFPFVYLALSIAVFVGVFYIRNLSSYDTRSKANTDKAVVRTGALDKDSSLDFTHLPYTEDELIVKYTNTSTDTIRYGVYQSMRSKYGVISQKLIYTASEGGVYKAGSSDSDMLKNIYLLKFSTSYDMKEVALDFSHNENVEYAHPNYLFFSSDLPNDTYISPLGNNTWKTGSWGQSYEDMWGLKITETDRAWSTATGRSIVVAVVDTGVDYNHEDLSSNIWINTKEIANNKVDDDKNGYIDDYYGVNLVSESSTDPIDDNGHGTHVSGTIAAVRNNRKGIAGMAPDNP